MTRRRDAMVTRGHIVFLVLVLDLDLKSNSLILASYEL
jgi:hypothetical protein